MSLLERVLTPLRAFVANDQQRRTLMLILATVGVLVLLLGGYTFLEAHNRYTELSAVAERLGPPTDPNDASNHAFALLLRDRDRAGTRRFEGVMYMGIGLVVLGLAYTAAPPRRAVSPANPPDPAAPPAGGTADHA